MSAHDLLEILPYEDLIVEAAGGAGVSLQWFRLHTGLGLGEIVERPFDWWAVAPASEVGAKLLEVVKGAR